MMGETQRPLTPTHAHTILNRHHRHAHALRQGVGVAVVGGEGGVGFVDL
jgi:hypothetical protein